MRDIFGSKEGHGMLVKLQGSGQLGYDFAVFSARKLTKFSKPRTGGKVEDRYES